MSASAPPEPIIHRSPLPDVEIPDVPLTQLRARTGGGAGGQAGPDRRLHRTDPHLRRGERRGAQPGRRPGGAGLREGRRAGDHGPEHPRVRDRVPRHGAWPAASITTINPTYTEREVHHQLVDAGAIAPGDRPGAPRDGRAAATADTDVTEIVVMGEAEGATLARPRWFGRSAGRAGPGVRRRPRRAAVLVGHDRPLEGRDAHPPQPGGQHRADHRPSRSWPRTTCSIAVLPFFHIYGMQMHDELRPDRRRAPSSPCPASTCEQFLRCTRSTASPGRSWRRPSSSPWPSTRWSTTTTCPSLRLVFSGAAPLSAELAHGGRRAGSAAGASRATG